MPDFTITLTATQIQRIQEAKDIYNARANAGLPPDLASNPDVVSNLTAQQFSKLMLRQTVVGYLLTEAVAAARATSQAELEGEWT